MLKKKQKIGLLSLIVASVAVGMTQAQETGLTSWKSGLNHDRIIQIQNEGGTRDAVDGVEIAYYSNSSFGVTSPKGISIIVDPWRNDPSGAWGLWYHVDFPAAEVDIGMSTHAHFDHDALDKIDANMLLDRMGGTFELGDVKITGFADKHQCVAPGLVPWTEAVKQFEGRDDPCTNNYRHMDNTMYLIETGGMRLFMWGDNRPEPAAGLLDKIGDVDVVFVPVDGSRHILDYEQADAVVEMTKANIAIPHHYLVPETTYFTSTLLPADEWAKTHDNTFLDAPSVVITKDDLEGKEGHVYYFGSHNIVTAEK